MADPARPGGRHLLLDDLEHSYVALDDPTHLESEHTRWIADAIDSMSRPKVPRDVVFIGAGGFTLPRWLPVNRKERVQFAMFFEKR